MFLILIIYTKQQEQKNWAEITEITIFIIQKHTWGRKGHVAPS